MITDLGLLAVSFWRAVWSVIDEVRRAPTWIPVTMTVIVVIGTLVALAIR